MKTLICHYCRKEMDYEAPLSRAATCPHCQRSSKVCLNCLNYDPHAHHECREDQAEWVRYKDEANFCSYFTPQGAQNSLPDLSSAKDALAQLFSKDSANKINDADSSSKSLADELAAFLKKK